MLLTHGEADIVVTSVPEDNDYCVNEAWNVAENGENNIECQVEGTSLLEEDADRLKAFV